MEHIKYYQLKKIATGYYLQYTMKNIVNNFSEKKTIFLLFSCVRTTRVFVLVK